MPRVASNSRNDEFVNTTPCPLRHCETSQNSWQSITTIHCPSSLRGAKRRSNPQTTNNLCFYRKNKRINHLLPPLVIAKAEGLWQSTNHKTPTKNRKEKEITTFCSLRHCETSQKSWQSTNHKKSIQKQERKRNHYYLINQRINFK